MYIYMFLLRMTDTTTSEYYNFFLGHPSCIALDNKMITECEAVGEVEIDRGNRNIRENSLYCHFVHHKSHMTSRGSNPVFCGGKPSANCLKES
jgi:hypothetical protein